MDGLKLYLDAGNKRSYDANTNVWYDMSKNGNNGTIFSSPIYNSKSLFFDGIDDYINMSQPNITFSPNIWTICVLMKPGSLTSRFLTPNSVGVDQYLQYDHVSQNIDVHIAESPNTNERNRSTTNNSIPIDIWSYVCVSINDLNIKIYVNGLLNSEYNETITIAGWSNQWRLGQRGNSTHWYLGNIAVLQVYDKILMPSEVKQNFNALRGRFGI